MARDERGERRRRTTALLSPLRLPDFRRLWAADMISLLGDWAGRLALTVLVLERTGSPAWAAAVTAVSLAGLRRHRTGARHPRRPLRSGHA